MLSLALTATHAVAACITRPRNLGRKGFLVLAIIAMAIIFYFTYEKIILLKGIEKEYLDLIVEKSDNANGTISEVSKAEAMKGEGLDKLVWINVLNFIAFVTVIPFVHLGFQNFGHVNVIKNTIGQRELMSNDYLKRIHLYMIINMMIIFVGEIWVNISLQGGVQKDGFVSVCAWHSLIHSCVLFVACNMLVMINY